MENWAVYYLIGWSLVTISFFITGGIRLYKFFKKKKRPHLTLIQGGKKDGPHGKSR